MVAARSDPPPGKRGAVMRTRRDELQFQIMQDYRKRLETMERHRQAARTTAVFLGVVCVVLLGYLLTFVRWQ